MPLKSLEVNHILDKKHDKAIVKHRSPEGLAWPRLFYHRVPKHRNWVDKTEQARRRRKVNKHQQIRDLRRIRDDHLDECLELTRQNVRPLAKHSRLP